MTQPFTHFATNQHPGAFQCVTYNSRQHSPFTSRVIVEAVYYEHPHILNFSNLHNGCTHICHISSFPTVETPTRTRTCSIKQALFCTMRSNSPRVSWARTWSWWWTLKNLWLLFCVRKGSQWNLCESQLLGTFQVMNFHTTPGDTFTFTWLSHL